MIASSLTQLLTFVVLMTFTIGIVAAGLWTLARALPESKSASKRVVKAREDAIVAEYHLKASRSGAEADVVEARRVAFLDAAKQGPEALEAAINAAEREKERLRRYG